MYEIEFLKAVRKDIKRLSPQVREFIINNCLSKIQHSSRQYLRLHGQLKGYWKYSVGLKGVTYRIIYQIYESEKVILIIAVGAREEFYDRLLRRLG